jgi:hypothetical protein
VTLAEYKTRIWQRLEEDPLAPVRYSAAEVVGAVNRGLRLLALLSLYNEQVGTVAATGATWYRLFASLPGLLVPLRVRYIAVDGTATRLRPMTLQQLDALDTGWQAAPGTPSRYGVSGFDLAYLYKQPASGSFEIWHAAAPPSLVEDGDAPGAPEEYHDSLIGFALFDLTLNEGGSILAAHAGGLADFFEAATRLARYMRARCLAQRYDVQPWEISAADLSALIKTVRGAKPKAPVRDSSEVV